MSTAMVSVAEGQSVVLPENDLSAAELVARLHDGRLRPGDLSASQRQQCVDYLTFEGFSSSDIAQLMHICERTVRRDRAAVRRENAIHPDLNLGDELLGEFQQVVMCANQRLIRLVRDERIAPNSRLWAESVIVQNFQRFIETTHRLHYMADGKKRLDQLVAQDPTELDRQADAINRNLLILDKAIERRSKRK